MSPLAEAILKLLAGGPTLTAWEIVWALHRIRFDDRPDPLGLDEVQSALGELTDSGMVAIVQRRGAAHYRLIHASAAVVADERDRT